MKRNLYTKEEIILCTYIAKFGRGDFNENDIHNLNERSVRSLKMKVQNIASMLFENGIDIEPSVSKLTGKPSGEKGRMTNWDIVESLSKMNQNELLMMCERII